MTSEAASKLSYVSVEMDYELCISTPAGLAVTSDVMLKDCPIIINGRKFMLVWFILKLRTLTSYWDWTG